MLIQKNSIQQRSSVTEVFLFEPQRHQANKGTGRTFFVFLCVHCAFVVQIKMIALFSLVPVLVFAQPNSADVTTRVTSPLLMGIKDSIESEIRSGAVPSVSVAVSRSGKVIWLQSFGWADKSKKIKAQPSTPYAIASLSKTITSTALMVLVEQGLVRLNDPVDKYLEGSKLTYYKGHASQLTIEGSRSNGNISIPRKINGQQP